MDKEMVIVQINGGSTGSTGKIMAGIRECAQQQGIQVICASPITATNRFAKAGAFIPIGTYSGRRISELLARITGLSGCFSVLATLRFLRKLRRISPDVVHLHTLHSSYINLPMLFQYLKKRDIPVVWTLHDCWSFTGHCPHFVSVNCGKWKTGCSGCPLYRQYPISIYDNSALMFRLKRSWFSGLNCVKLVTPSQWLADMVSASFLAAYPVQVVNNGIDLQVFRPTLSDLRARHQLGQKHIVLGVAYGWSDKKGLHVFQQLAQRLDSQRYQIILIGTDEVVETQLDPQIISVRRTQDQQELAAYYSVADVLLNPTLEDTFPTVNMEALACGTPVLTFATGGSPEILRGDCGSVVPCGDTEAMEKELLRICREKPYTSDACRRRAGEFCQIDKFRSYIALYRGFYE